MSRLERLRESLTTRHYPCDIWLIISVIGLAGLGWVMVSSASIGLLENSYYYSRQHGIFLVISILACLVMISVPLEVWRQNAALLLLASIFMLVLVLIIGQEVNGSKRWISLPGPLPSLQVSEFAKLGLIFYMAAFMSRFTYELRQRAFSMWRPLAVLAIPAGLLFLAPDFGGMVVYTVCVIGMLMMSGASLTLLLGSGGVLASGAVMMVVMEPYRLARWTSFLDPWADQFATGYQLTQALIAFGRGHVTGTGLGNSVQKLHYLPEAHTDFIFAVVAEELGMIGAIIVVLLFTVFITRTMWIARRAELAGHMFGAYVSYGIGFIIAAQAFINMAVSAGLLPTKGLTLPLISYGGSSLLVTGLMVGLLLRVDAETRHRPRRTPTPYKPRHEPRLS
ncbi:putative lipid II flippase FtsW [Halomonas sp. M1]|uniref:putative lipid II flippase FtsW n=1 Tax=unclassified Halomonas TaxID=2609666 RepID=UPI00023A4BAE|nr:MULTISPECIES: putative lipid II flippase FtsW [unclassified Halomonas]AVI63123.1 cell division protein FtsW [Halomonas sp. GFAJ-1]EHK60444.1 cell division protein FtsW [Halomonas sp. GFAJ-1]MDP3534256.1 putative lipid II flippase FtsW [Halomonas sp.]WFE72248.1 putative lipid II flippase FtsW [Halomonas sp. M1]